MATGRTDLAVYWPAGGNWYVRRSSGGTTIQNWGWADAIPVPADYDGDGKTDLARLLARRWHMVHTKQFRGHSDVQLGLECRAAAAYDRLRRGRQGGHHRLPSRDGQLVREAPLGRDAWRGTHQLGLEFGRARGG
jgi:hypothetical protein